METSPLSPNLDSVYRLLVQGITDYAIYMLSLEGKVSNWNAGAQRFKGYSANEIVGHHFSRFYPETDRVAGLPELALSTALKDGRFEGEGWRLRKDGSRFWAHVIIDLILDDEGNKLGFAKITRDMTEQREAARLAHEQERNFRLLVQGISDYAIYMLYPDGTVSNWNAGAERFKGYKAEEIVGKHFSTFYSVEDRRKGLPYRALATALACGSFNGEGWRHRRDGSRFWAHVVIDPIRDEEGTLLGYAKITRDLTQSKRQMDEVSTIRENLDRALTHMSQGLCLFDRTERLVLCNSRFQQILGLSNEAARPGSTFTDLLWAQHVDSSASPEELADRVAADRLHHIALLEQDQYVPRTEQLWQGRTISIQHRRLPEGGWVSTMEDVTDQKKIETQINRLAHFDSLTGLPNRVSLHRHLSMALEAGNPCALLYVDLDRFKPVNDTFGHSVGDAVLQIISGRIETHLRKNDVGARLGGDEFAVFLPECTIDDAISLAKTLICAISQPMLIRTVEVNVGASIGIALSPMAEGDVEVFVRNADLALYAAKQAGRGCLREYESCMEARLEERRTLDRDLRDALANGEFELNYQPVVDVGSNRVVTCEALLRWNSPTRGRVAPVNFIPYAEEIGLMPEIGKWILRTACSEAASWPTDVGVSVNISPAQFTASDLVGNVTDCLVNAGLEPHRLELELTETCMIRDLSGAKCILGHFRSLGMQVALDDFGTGYSSLSFLRELPFTRIKIDRSFIHDLSTNKESLAIVRAVTTLCAALNVSTIAEGVETEEQLEILRKEGCTMLQGYLICRPCALDVLRVWLLDYQQRAAALTSNFRQKA